MQNFRTLGQPLHGRIWIGIVLVVVVKAKSNSRVGLGFKFDNTQKWELTNNFREAEE